MKEFLTNRTAYWTSSTLGDGSNLSGSKCVGGLCLRVKVKKIKMAELEQLNEVKINCYDLPAIDHEQINMIVARDG